MKRVARLAVVCFALALAILPCAVPSSVPPVPPVLILVDGFSSYLSGHCKPYCEERGITVRDVVSPYICGAFRAQVC
ncbi:hypothetical protein B484DRAFT_408627 [Ochromonadaceae sp. CCMP2298]|nr:hypothetical protein B484DRAFT_408627 [Ochromonadaceae sp. CCMP2298]